MDKQQKKAARKRWKLAERTELLASMPVSPDQLHRLLEDLDANLKSCDHTTKLTATFLDVENLETDKVLSWLGEQGGYCDCEVLANLDDLDASLQAPASVPRIGPRKRETGVPRSLETIAGWNLSNLPSPWRVANRDALTEPVRLELGKKGGCSIEIIEEPIASSSDDSDEFWARLWYARTELSPRDVLQVRRGVLDVHDGFRSTLVLSPSSTPVYCWIVPETGHWYIEVRTGLDRYAGDLPQIASLISHLARR
jgi:hypothetical protein